MNFDNDQSNRHFIDFVELERCNPWPHVINRHISISQLLSFWRHSHYDGSSRSHDVIRIVTSFATEADLATPTVTDVRTYVRTDTLPRLIYKDGGRRHRGFLKFRNLAVVDKIGGLGHLVFICPQKFHLTSILPLFNLF